MCSEAMLAGLDDYDKTVLHREDFKSLVETIGRLRKENYDLRELLRQLVPTEQQLTKAYRLLDKE